MNILQWIVAHWQEIVAGLGGLVLTARIIVKLTPTPADDSVLEKVVEFLKHLGLHINQDK